MSRQPEVVPVRVAAVVVDPNTQAPVVILRDETDPRRYLPIFIGGTEATSIASALAGMALPRPLTHDLMLDLMVRTGWRVAKVTVTELREGTFYAKLTVERAAPGAGTAQRLTLDARPSDSIALALRAKAPIFVAHEVLEEAGGLAKEAEEKASAGTFEGATEAEAPDDGSDDEGRALLSRETRLEDVDPDLFGKYKM